MKQFVLLRESISALNFVGLTLRGASMLGKLALVLLLSKFGSLEDLGVYGLFVTSIALLNYLQGLEFNRYTAREITVQDPARATEMVGNQLFVHLLTYLIVLPLSLLVFVGGFLSWDFVFYFLCVAVFTHFGQEANRLLIIFASANAAYIVSFLIHGLWACIAALVFLFAKEYVTLDLIFILWCGSSMLGFAVGVLFLVRTQRFGFSKLSIDKEWIKEGLKISVKFFVAVVAYKIVELSDRFFLQYFHGEALVGVYTFYASVANIVQEFVYTGAVVVLIPALLTNYKMKDYERYNRLVNKLRSTVWIFSTIASVFALVFMFLLINYIDRDPLSDNFLSFALLVVACFLLNLSLIPHYKLYLAGRDSALMWSALIGVVLNVILNFFLIPDLGIFGAALATTASFSLVLMTTLWLAKRFSGVEQL